MLEEKNDSLHTADGNVENVPQEVAQTTVLEVPVELAEESIAIDNQNESAVNAIASINAAESEDETLKARHEIPMLDYETLDMDTLVTELEKLVAIEKVMSVKEHIEEIKSAFLSKYNH